MRAAMAIGMALLLATTTTTTLHATVGQGKSAEPDVATGPLRLDEAPGLTLLESLRHADGSTTAGYQRYLWGSFGGWLRMASFSLDWATLLPRRHWLAGQEAPINPRLAASPSRQGPCFARLTRVQRGFPSSLTRHHFFHDTTATQLWLSDELMPPWLSRLDHHWAHALLMTSGCGRGGLCSQGTNFPAANFQQLLQALQPAQDKPPWWVCRERPVTIRRQGSEEDRFVLLRCDGSIADDALERLSKLARPVRVQTPPQATGGSDGGPPTDAIMTPRLIHPRLLWVLHRVALAFPWRALFLYSGYRLSPSVSSRASAISKHYTGRALDVSVQGVASERLLALCRQLPDVGCGYYPNNKFIHLDVRKAGHGKGLWIDASGPGEPSRYVESWPGVIDNGKFIWRAPTGER